MLILHDYYVNIVWLLCAYCLIIMLLLCDYYVDIACLLCYYYAIIPQYAYDTHTLFTQ